MYGKWEYYAYTVVSKTPPFFILLQLQQTLTSCCNIWRNIPSSIATAEQLLIYPFHLHTADTHILGKFSSSKTMCQHTVRIRRSSYCSVKHRYSFLRTFGFQLALILTQLTTNNWPSLLMTNLDLPTVYEPFIRLPVCDKRCMYEAAIGAMSLLVRVAVAHIL